MLLTREGAVERSWSNAYHSLDAVAQLMRDVVQSFDKSWMDLLDRLTAKRAAPATSAHIGAHNA